MSIDNDHPGGKIAGEHAKKAIAPSEAIYGFAAWLTTIDGTVKVGRAHNAAIVADLVNQYIKAQGYGFPAEDFHERLRRMGYVNRG